MCLLIGLLLLANGVDLILTGQLEMYSHTKTFLNTFSNNKMEQHLFTLQPPCQNTNLYLHIFSIRFKSGLWLTHFNMFIMLQT